MSANGRADGPIDNPDGLSCAETALTAEIQIVSAAIVTRNLRRNMGLFPNASLVG